MNKNISHKIIKKIFIIYLLIFFGFINNSYAEGSCESCKIKNGTPEILLEYISNNRKIIQNISKNLGEAKYQASLPTDVSVGGKNKSAVDLKDAKNAKDVKKFGYAKKRSSVSSGIGLRVYNSLFNWKESESGFKYFLANIDGDVPAPISRDLRLIDNQNRTLNYFLSSVIENGYSFNNIDPDKVCKGIKDNSECSEKLGKDIETAIKKLINNNSKINLLIRKELGFKGFNDLVGDSSYDDLFLVPDDFMVKMKQNYNGNTYESCAKCDGGSIDKIEKIKDKIMLNDKESKDGISEWKNAWNLLLGVSENGKDEYNKKEKELLRDELSRQGVSSSNADSVLNNLDNFGDNTFGFSPGNNPITNSYNYYIGAITKAFEPIKFNNLIKSIGDITDAFPNTEDFTINELNTTNTNLLDENKIKDTVDQLVQQNIALVSRQNKSTDKLQGRIIQLHINLTQTINTLQGMITKAEKICNSQADGEGNCSGK